MAENFHLNKTGNQLGVGFATKKEKKKKGVGLYLNDYQEFECSALEF